MNPFSAAFFVFLAGTGVLSAAVPAQDAPETRESAPEPSIGELIADLSSENFAVREKATLKLWTLGEPALTELKKASTGDDPEVAFRTSKLIRDIEHFFTPDTDPELIQHVEDYKKAFPKNKVEIFRKIAMKRGWHQLLKLYADETDPAVLAELLDQAHGASIIGAREKIILGKNDEARKFLELAPRDARSLMALACFHRSNGTLEEERRKADTGPADWRAALARVAGDTATAAAAAKEAGDPHLAAAMGLFNGDFLPWLDLMKESEQSTSRKLYMDIIGGRWDPEREEEARIALRKLSAEASGSRDEAARGSAAWNLFLSGHPDLAEAALTKAPVLQAIDYYSSIERFDDALSTFGLDPAAPDFKRWVEEKFGIYLNQKRFENDRAGDQSSEAEKELLRMAVLLNQLGLEEEMLSAFEKPLLSMAETELDDFLILLATLFAADQGPSDTAVLAQAVATKWAGDDEGRWRQLVNLAFNEDEVAIQWWDWLAVLDEESSFADQFEGMLGLFGAIPDPKRTRDRWLGLAWKAVEKAAPAQKSQYLKRIAYTSDFSRTEGRFADMATSLKVQGMQAAADQSSALQTQNFMGLSIRGEWDQVAEIFTKMIAGDRGDKVSLGRPELHAYLAASLRRAGREDEAVVHDGWAEKLSLGDSGSSIIISNAYAFGGDMERASTWLARYAIESSPTPEPYGDLASGYTLDAFNRYSVQLLEQGRWKESAALAEAMALRANDGDTNLSLAPFLLNIRLRADLPHGLSLLEGDRERGLDLLDRCHSYFPGVGHLADYFFPALRKAGLIKEHDEYFEKSWKVMSGLIERFPRSGQTLNGSAWLAARAVRRLPEGEALSRKALALNPDEAAYLDTLGEIHFSKKDRKGAVKWSALATNFAPGDSMIRRQYERFSADPFPGD
ncbi:hypothetical protein OVA24_11195 [Luteolibacter sp. SL250]|uniref:hypothetical protein n=1 Tax=Luteolibacter sp. SL250 TaxID=2995170 RepID=UPI00227007E4|nr:hypothetical protein [Luteolibacter sp. SL250]WAC17809.1 hypothetical protein OVA24_11195 [Luteolibacter sp. SL250]